METQSLIGKGVQVFGEIYLQHGNSILTSNVLINKLIEKLQALEDKKGIPHNLRVRTGMDDPNLHPMIRESLQELLDSWNVYKPFIVVHTIDQVDEPRELITINTEVKLMQQEMLNKGDEMCTG